MKSESATRHKLKQVRFRHLKKRLAAALKERPENCAHNHSFKHPLTNGTLTGMCLCPEQEGDRLCDPDWGGMEKAKSCPLFQPQQTKDEVKDDFNAELIEMSFAQIAYSYPDLAALMWVLGEEEVSENWEELPQSSEDTEEVETQWVEMQVQGVRLRVDSPESKEVLDKVLEDVAALDESNTHVVETLNTALATTMQDNTRLREKLAEMEARQQSSLVRGAEPLPWWRRWFGGTNG